MRRRQFIAGLGSAAVWPVVAQAQQGDRVWRIGVLTPYGENDPTQRLALLHSPKRLQTWVGPTVATCGWAFVGALKT